MEQTLGALAAEPRAAIECAVLRGRAHLAGQESANAPRVLEDAACQAPRALMPFIFLSHVPLQSGDEAAAEPVLRHIVGMAPAHAESWRNPAVPHRRRGQLREAVAAAQSGRVHCPNDADLLLLHGALLREAGDWINAESCLVRLLE